MVLVVLIRLRQFSHMEGLVVLLTPARHFQCMVE